MGNCLSGDVDGGKQAVGGAQLRPLIAQNTFGTNEAIDFFFRARGLTALFTQIEVYLCRDESWNVFLLFNLIYVFGGLSFILYRRILSEWVYSF